jgi:hypothetical protein
MEHVLGLLSPMQLQGQPAAPWKRVSSAAYSLGKNQLPNAQQIRIMKEKQGKVYSLIAPGAA